MKQSTILLVALLFASFSQNSEAVSKRSVSLKPMLVAVFSVLNLPGNLADEDIGLCCLCDQCGPPVSGREDMFVDADGTTCTDLVLEMADPSNGSTVGSFECESLKAQHYARCCDPNHDPLPIEQNPTEPPYEQGDEPICNLCEDGSFPTRPNTVIAVLPEFIPGTNTCEDLYWMGLYGHISDQICNPLVDFAEEPCGCLTSESTNPPTTAPTPSPGIGDYPPKKERPHDSSKDSSKLHQSDRDRGGLHLRQVRRLGAKGR